MSQIEVKHPAILETVYALGETTLIANAAKIVDLCRHRRTDRFNRLSAITADDWPTVEPRFEIVYHLHSTERNLRLRVKCKVAAEIDSVTGVWRGANWYEREIFDMFCVGFRNHPNLVRILMPMDWEGHPLRKDYPVHGYKYSYPREGGAGSDAHGTGE